MENTIALVAALASFVTALATLIYVGYSVGMLKELRKQTDRLSLSTRYDAAHTKMLSNK